MKTFALFCGFAALIASQSASALDSNASVITAAAVVAVRDFEGKLAAPSKDYFIGFRAGKVSETSSEVFTYALSSPTTLSKNKYDCATVPSVRCVDKGGAGTFAYKPGSRIFTPQEFETGLNAALEIFVAKAGDPATIESAKVWQTNGNLEFSFSYRPAGGATKAIYMMCHYHEPGEMDCHKQSRPGQNEPQN